MPGAVLSSRTLNKLILRFDTYKKGRFWGVNVWHESLENLPKISESREYLSEHQYAEIAKWCSRTFNTRNQPLRARRMSYADFWFASERDRDWFVLHWSGVDADLF